MDKTSKKKITFQDNPKTQSIAREMVLQALDYLEDEKQKLEDINQGVS